MKLQDRVAIVTGAAQGIGKAVADKLAAEGAKVVAVDVNGEGAERTAAGVDGTAVQADISSPEDVQRMVDETVSRHGKVDVLANVAAIVPFTAWDDITFDEWRRIMSVNLDGLFLTMKAVEKPMRDEGYGRIVNVTSNVISSHAVKGTIAATLASTSTLPCRESVSSTMRRTSSELETSACTAVPSTSAAVRSAPSPFRSTATTFAPSPASLVATALPIP